MNKKGAKYLLLFGFHPKNRPADLPGPARPGPLRQAARPGPGRAGPGRWPGRAGPCSTLHGVKSYNSLEASNQHQVTFLRGRGRIKIKFYRGNSTAKNGKGTRGQKNFQARKVFEICYIHFMQVLANSNFMHFLQEKFFVHVHLLITY